MQHGEKVLKHSLLHKEKNFDRKIVIRLLNNNNKLYQLRISIQQASGSVSHDACSNSQLHSPFLLLSFNILQLYNSLMNNPKETKEAKTKEKEKNIVFMFSCYSPRTYGCASSCAVLGLCSGFLCRHARSTSLTLFGMIR
jgi:hypothetical protein